MKVVRSTCNYCSIACNFDFHVEDDGFIQRVKPAKDYPVNRGFCCVKGLNLDKQNTIYENPVLPLLRNEKGELEHISWDKAFNIFAERVKKIQDEYGKESFAFLSTGQLCTEEMALAGHIGRTFLGGNGDGNTRLCMATAVVAYKQSFGFDSPPYTFEDLELSDVMIFIGCNPVVAHPILWSRVIKNRNKDKKIITIDPRRSETVTNSDIWIDLKPKSDLRLLYTLSNVLIEKGWIDEEFIKNSTEDFEGFKNHVKKYDVNDVEEYTGISKGRVNVLIEKGWIDEEFIKNSTEDFEGFKNHVKKYDVNDVEEYTGISKGRVLELAKIIHEGKRVSFWWTMGVNQGYQAVRTAQAVINLALMTGNIGRPGTGANSITGQCNAMGSRLFSNTTGLYGGGEYTDKARRKVVAKALGIDEEMLPKKPTIPYNAIIEGINNGTIKALWVLATNPVVSWINSLEFKKAAEKLEFLAVQDIYSDTETCKYAHLILPSTNGLKKEGVLINTERRLSKIQPVLEKKKDDIYSDTETCKYAHLILPSTNGLKKEGVLINTERRLSKIQPVLEKKKDELSDYDILLGIGNALGMGSLLDKWKTPKDAFEVLKECTRNMPCDITGVSYDMLKDSKGIQALGMGSLLDKWKTPKDAFEVLKECTRNMPCDITGVSYDMLKDSKGIQWPFKEGDDIEKEERRLFEDKKFYTPNKKAKFIYEDIMSPPFEQNEEYPYILNTGRGTVGQWHTQTRTREITPNKKAKFIYEDIMSPPFEQNEEYPYILNTGRGTVGQWHTQTRTREIPDVEAIIMKEGYINLNTDLAEELDIKENDMVKVSSPNGVSNKFLVKLSRTVKKDQLYAPMHYIEANSILPSIFDTYSKEPNYKYGPVKIEKIN